MNRIFSLVYEYKSITLNIKGFIYSLKRIISVPLKLGRIKN